MSSGTPDGERLPVMWPADRAASDTLQDWAAGPDDAHVYATELDFRGADLTGLDFYYFFAVKCDFSGTVLVRTDFAGSYLVDTNFTGADLSEAVLPQASLVGSVFDGATLRRANLRDVSAKEATFVGATLVEADVEGYFADCDFTGADLSGARIDGVLTRAVVTDIRATGTIGSIYGPLVVRENGQETVLHEREAENWLAARGADVTVKAASA